MPWLVEWAYYPAVRPIRCTTQLWVATHHPLCALVLRTTFRGETSGSVANLNFGCFLMYQRNRFFLGKIPSAGQGERNLWEREWCSMKKLKPWYIKVICSYIRRMLYEKREIHWAKVQFTLKRQIRQNIRVNWITSFHRISVNSGSGLRAPVNRPLALRGHVTTNQCFLIMSWNLAQWCPKSTAHKNYLTLEIWEETHLREIFYGTMIFRTK